MRISGLLTPVVRISMGLVFLTVSLLLVADLFGLVSGNDDGEFSSRKQLSESLAAMFSTSIERDDTVAIEETMKLLVKRNDDIRSMGLRNADGRISAAAGEHAELWVQTQDKRVAENWAVPLFGHGGRWGDVEIIFAKKSVPTVLGIQMGPLVLLILFVSVSGFFLFRMFMQKTLRHLDPSSVVPEQVQTALNVLAEGVAIFDEDQHIVLANKAFAKKIGARIEDILGRKIDEIGWSRRHGQKSSPWPWEECIATGREQIQVKLNIDTVDSSRTYMVNAAPVHDHREEVRGALATFEEITLIEYQNDQLEYQKEQLQNQVQEIEKQNERLSYLATHDPLTGCLNRRSFFRMLENAFEESRETGIPVACVMTDIDNFKSFNDTYGHLVGDEVIQRVASSLGSALRDEDRLCRYGGEEFCLLMPGLRAEEAAQAAERLRKMIATQDKDNLAITCSFGVAAIEFEADSASGFVDQADKALYESKRAGRDRVTIWYEGLEEQQEKSIAAIEAAPAPPLIVVPDLDEDFGATSTNIEQHLYHVEEENRWYHLAIELLASLGEMHRCNGSQDFRGRIFDSTSQHLRRLIQFECTAFAMFDPDHGGAILQGCSPSSASVDLQEIIALFSERGDIDMALGEEGPVELRAGDGNLTVLVHSIPTHAGGRYFFIGRLPDGAPAPKYAACSLLSIILQSAASALDNAELYHVVNAQNAELEDRLEARTRELEHHQLHDGLTGLPNRSLLRDRLQHSVSLACRDQSYVAMMVVDIDMLKRINNTLGHHVGDELLTRIGERLLEVLRNSDTVARLGHSDLPTVSRLGGDEFGIILSGLKETRNVRGVVSRMIERLAEPFVADGRELHITTSVGISLFPHDGDSPDVLLRKAESAMFHAKRRRRNDYHFFTSDMNAGAIRYMELESHLRSAIANDEFELHYQPKVELVGGSIVGVEALLRWTSSALGSVSPAEFIPVAESSGLIPAIGEWVLRAACQQARIWNESGIGQLNIAINLSPLQLRRSELRDKIFSILRDNRILPSQIEFEITETVLMEHMETSVSLLQTLADAGARIAVDDFGTGYSSLGHLKRFPIHTLKIDRMFIQDIESDSNDIAIVTAMVEMSRAMGMQCVAEGVETTEQLRILRAIECEILQGYLFSRPVPAAEITAMLHADKRLDLTPVWSAPELPAPQGSESRSDKPLA